MEQFVLGMFQDQLSKFIIGFRKEQVNANLLNGKGEIRNVELNCDVLNEHLRRMSSHFWLKRIHISKCSFHVSSWTNLRKSPIYIDLEHVTAQLVEPLHHVDRSKRVPPVRQILLSEFIHMLREGLMVGRQKESYGGTGTGGGGAYSLLDRILDNLTIEIATVKIQYQLLGTFKTARPGPWIPPALHITLAGVRWVSVNEFGQEGPPEEVWRHSHHHHHHDTYMIYKRLQMDYQIALAVRTTDGQEDDLIFPLLSSSLRQSAPPYPTDAYSTNTTDPLQIQVVMKRRVRNGDWLSVQIDGVVPHVTASLPAHVVPLLAQWLAAARSCFAKSKSFEPDPLVAVSSGQHRSQERQHTEDAPLGLLTGDEVGINITLASFQRIDQHTHQEREEKDHAGGGRDDDSTSTAASDTLTSPNDHRRQQAGDVDDDEGFRPMTGTELLAQLALEQEVDSSSSSSASEDEGDSSNNKNNESLMPNTNTSPSAQQQQQQQQPSRPAPPFGYKDRPLLLLRNGLVIHERLTVSLSVHNVTVRGTYVPRAGGHNVQADGYVELVAKGCVAELIWPQANQEKGGYLQASISYLQIREKSGSRIRTLLAGGVEYDPHSPIEQSPKPLADVGRDETFPLYEDRSIRPDPLGLRHSFPAQALGIKTTVDFVFKRTNSNNNSNALSRSIENNKSTTTTTAGPNEDIRVMHEMGLDRFDIVLDSEAWCRALRFVTNADGLGFDQRWTTGDWSACLTANMLRDPDKPLQLEDHTQLSNKQFFLDENELISSDLFNVTARFTRVVARIPAAIREDLFSCDISFQMDESTLIVSSALPRTFLSGKIGNSVNGDDATEKGLVEFPNDPSDIAYTLEMAEDPQIRQQGGFTSRAISTFRLQLTLRGVSARLIPVVSFCNNQQTQQLLAPAELTTIICFEGEPPDSAESNIIKVAIFASALFHRLHLNFDFDLLVGALSTLAFHADVIKNTVKSCRTAMELDPTETTEVDLSEASADDEMDGRIRRTMGGRRVLVKQQIVKSREAGGLSVVLGVQVAEFGMTLWRQNVPRSSPLRATQHGDDKNDFIPSLKLLQCDLNQLEVGLEATYRLEKRRIVGKMCLSHLVLRACRLPYLEALDAEPFHEMVDILSVGNRTSSSLSYQRKGDDPAINLRIEEQQDEERACSASLDIADGFVAIQIDELEAVALLMFEALLVRVNSHRLTGKIQYRSTVLPAGSVGALIGSIVFLARSEIRSFAGEDHLGEMTRIERSSKSGSRLSDFPVLERLMPADLRVILIRLSLREIQVCIPGRTGIEPDSKSNGFRFAVHRSECVASFADAGYARNLSILDVAAAKHKTWAYLVDELNQGINVTFSSTQSLQAFTGSASRGIDLDSCLIKPFDFCFNYSEAKGLLNVANGLELGSISLFREFVSCFMTHLRRCQTGMQISSKVINMERRRAQSISGDSGSWSRTVSNDARIPSSSYASSRPSFDVVRSLLARIKECALRDEASLTSALVEKELETRELRKLVFLKEKERLSALALVSSQATGWLRVGSARRSGQRNLMTGTLYPYWSILRRSLLFLYPAPGQVKASDVISLRGASLRELSGGSRKRDLKRAFAILDSRGAVTFVIAGSDSEYCFWVRELYRVINSIPFESNQQLDAHEAASQSKELDSNWDTSGSDIEERSATSSSQSRRIGRGLTRAVQVAKATGKAVARARRGPEQVEISGEISQEGKSAAPVSGMSQTHVEVSSSGRLDSPQANETDVDDSATGSQGRLLRSRFASVGQVTKSKFGSALQAARQKGREVAEKRRQRIVEGSDDLSRHGPAHSEKIEVVQTVARAAAPDPMQGRHPSTSNEAWACTMCTFLNPSGLSTCQMCDTPRPTNDDVSDTSEVPVSGNLNSTTANHSEVESPRDTDSTRANNVESDEIGLRVGVRGRLGAAVRSVRRGRGEDQDLEGDQNRSGGRFNFIRRPLRQEDGDASERVEATKLRGVVVGGHLEQAIHPFESVESSVAPLAQLPGRWFVKVEVHVTPEESLKSVGSNSCLVEVDGCEPNASMANAIDPQSFDQDKGANSGKSPISFSDSTFDVRIEGEAIASLITGNERESPPFKVPLDKQRRLGGGEFQIAAFRQAGRQVQQCPVASSTKKLEDFFHLHTAISESMSGILPWVSNEPKRTRLPSMDLPCSLARELGLTPLDTLRFTGQLLAALSNDSQLTHTSEDLQYHVDIISEFLLSLLECPLPQDTLLMVKEFLGLDQLEEIDVRFSADDSTRGTVRLLDSEQQIKFSKMDNESGRREILALASACETELVRAQNLASILVGARPSIQSKKLDLSGHANKRAEADMSESELSLDTLGSRHSCVTSSLFQVAMHKALTKVMEERDEFHARMVATGVLHVHELEQERAKLKQLGSQLDTLTRRTPEGAKFSNHEGSKDVENLRRMLREVQDNSDSEIMSLCQQLSGEISARTSSALEVLRLKESREIEREIEQKEKQALVKEVERLRHELSTLRTREDMNSAEEFDESLEPTDALIADAKGC